MRLDPPGLTGPPPTTARRGRRQCRRALRAGRGDNNNNNNRKEEETTKEKKSNNNRLSTIRARHDDGRKFLSADAIVAAASRRRDHPDDGGGRVDAARPGDATAYQPSPESAPRRAWKSRRRLSTGTRRRSRDWWRRDGRGRGEVVVDDRETVRRRESRSEESGEVVAIVANPERSAETSSVSSVDVLVAYTAVNDEDDDTDVPQLCSCCDETDDRRDEERVEVVRGLVTSRHATADDASATVSSSLQVHLPETTACVDVPGGRLELRRRDHPRDPLQVGILAFPRNRSDSKRFAENDEDDEDEEDDGTGGSDNTAWLANSITRRKAGGPDDRRRGNARTRRRRQRCHRWNYGLLLILCFLAWPLLCTAAPTTPELARNNGSVDRQAVNVTGTEIVVGSILPTAIALRAPYVEDIETIARGGGGGGGSTSHQVESSEWVHPYNEYAWEVNQINPWLSACDLAGPSPADLQGSCGPPGVPRYCPRPCDEPASFRAVIERLEASGGFRFGARTRGSTRKNGVPDDDDGDDGATTTRTAPEQCLFYLEESHKRDVCGDDFGRGFSSPRENRYWYASGLRLRHCCEHPVVNALAPGHGGPLEDVLGGGRRCEDALDKLLIVDALAARLHCKFEEVLARYDCSQPYSVIFNCTHCKEAYRKWVCSSLVPYFAHEGPLDLEPSRVGWTGSRIRPCRSVCHSVEQRCPYLLPGDRAPAYPTQYAGEPTFLCRDPNIPETGEQATRALHAGSADEECCFRFCSEREPATGICANCTGRETASRAADPPTAPHCEFPASQFDLPGPQQEPDVVRVGTSSIAGLSNVTLLTATRESSTWSPGTSTARGTSLCGGGGVGSVSISSSSSSTGAFVVPRLVSFCAILVTYRAGQDLAGHARRVRRDAGLVIGTSSSRHGVATLRQVIRRRARRVVIAVATSTTAKWRWCRGWWCWCWWWWISWRRRRKCRNGRATALCRPIAANRRGERRRDGGAVARRLAEREQRDQRRSCRRRCRRRGRRRRGKPPDRPRDAVRAFGFARRSRPTRWSAKKDPP